MDEIIVQVCRSIACTTRLNILALLANNTEITPTELAQRLKLRLPKISEHLRRLSAAGLIGRRPSGIRCYCVAKSPYGETALSGKMSRWLFRVLRERSDEHTRKLIFNAATAFTHLRRVQILRHLEAHGESDSETMTGQLKMSPAALSRHCAKLSRRGVIISRESPDGWRCRLAENLVTPVHRELIGIIRSSARK
jgi:DNA-binding MarR family transcriptional regulator